MRRTSSLQSFLTEARGKVTYRVGRLQEAFDDPLPDNNHRYEGADAYLLQNILHWRSDEDCLRILKTVHAAARPGAKLLVVEAIVEAANEPQFAKTLDIAMLVLTHGGKERTRAELQILLSAAGFRVSRIVPTASFASVIEAIRD